MLGETRLHYDKHNYSDKTLKNRAEDMKTMNINALPVLMLVCFSPLANMARFFLVI